MYIINTGRLSRPRRVTSPSTSWSVRQPCTLFPDNSEPRIIITCQQNQKMVSYYHLCINCAHKVGPRVYKSGKWACSQVYLSIHLYIPLIYLLYPSIITICSVHSSRHDISTTTKDNIDVCHCMILALRALTMDHKTHHHHRNIGRWIDRLLVS